MLKDSLDFIDKIFIYWYSKKGLTLVSIFTFIFSMSIFSKLGELTSLAIASILTILIGIIWLYSNKTPEVNKGKIGFVICVNAENEIEARKFRDDFGYNLRRLIKSGNLGKTFQFIEMPEHISKTIIDYDDAEKLRLKSKAHFLLYGRIRKIIINHEETNYLELDGIVRHNPISDTIGKKLAKEFTELLPRRVVIKNENDIFSFQFTSEWAEIVAKYIIGTAAAVSGDIQYAENLYLDALNKVNNSNSKFIIYEKLRERIPHRIFELKEIRAQCAYENWVKTKELRYIQELGVHVNDINYEEYKKVGILYLRAIYYFLINKDICEAKISLNKVPKKERNAAWYFNMGFLCAYEGDLKTAIRLYRNTLSLNIDNDLISKIEDFLHYFVTIDSSKFQLYYCLGFFNWQIKGDFLQAEQDIEKFITACTQDEYIKEKDIAEDWLNKVRNRTHV